jgi:hypothetical protein
LHQATPAELKARIEAERVGAAFLVLRDDEGEQQIVPLEPGAPRTIGRARSADVRLKWDLEVSRVHAELACVGSTWTLSDDGLSRNGTFVNGGRVSGKRRLADGDQIQLGATEIVFRDPAEPEGTVPPTSTRVPEGAGPELPPLTQAQERVAKALCRPFAATDGFATPATNQEIADELFLTVAAVKTHLRALFRRFEIEHLPQNGKRLRLVELLLSSGDVDERELRDS